MNAALRSTIERVRTRLEADSRSRVDCGYLRPASIDVSSVPRDMQWYADFLSVADGGECGGVILWRSTEIERFQQYCDGLAGGREKWYCIGVLDDDPIIVDRATGMVHYFFSTSFDDRDGYYANPTDISHQFGREDEFLEYYIFGVGHRTLIDSQEDYPWFRLLEELNQSE